MEAIANTEAEAGVIGAMLFNPNAIHEIRPVLDESDFHDETNRVLYRSLVNLIDGGVQIGDAVVLRSSLVSLNVWDKIGGAKGLVPYLGVPNAAHAFYYAEIVAEKSRARQIIATCQTAIADIENGEKPDDSKGILESRLKSIGARMQDDDLQMIDEGIVAMAEAIIDERKNRDQLGSDRGVMTGIWKLDDHTGGLFPGELTVIGARPSVGKTSLGFQICATAGKSGKSALFVSLEMQKRELCERYVACETGIDSRSMRTASVSDEELARIVASGNDATGMKFGLWRPERAVTIEKIRARCGLYEAKHGLDLVVIDFLTKVVSTNPTQARHEEITHIMNVAHDISIEFDCPVLMLAQAKRVDEVKREGMVQMVPPTMQDLYGSSQIEAVANNVWMLHRPTRSSTVGSLGLEKFRGGSVGRIDLEYDPQRTRFDSEQKQPGPEQKDIF